MKKDGRPVVSHDHMRVYSGLSIPALYMAIFLLAGSASNLNSITLQDMKGCQHYVVGHPCLLGSVYHLMAVFLLQTQYT